MHPDILSAIKHAQHDLIKQIQRRTASNLASHEEAAELSVPAEAFVFWRLKDSALFFTFIENLAVELDMLALEAKAYETLPLGYALVRYLMGFENHCQCSSWLAVANCGEDEPTASGLKPNVAQGVVYSL